MRWFVGDSGGTAAGPRASLYDSLFLAVVVALSCLPYVTGLGLYSDDWGLLSTLHNSDGSYSGLLASIMEVLAPRPVQGHILAGLYWLFGLDPLGYHALNSAALAAAVLLFYHSLRALGCSRLIALVVPLIFGLLPHYSTDRFWIAAFQANAAILLYFVSLYADVRFVLRPRGLAWLWKVLGTVALIGSVLSYEVTAALFLVNVVVLLHVAGVRHQGAWDRRALPAALAVASNILVLGLTIAYKLAVTERADIAGGLRYRALRVLTEGVPVHFGEYGLGLPVKVARALRDYPDALVITVSALIGLAVGAYLLLVVRPALVRFDRRVRWPAVMLAGAGLFAAGYGVALMTWEIGFHTTGANNRTAIGAAVGVSWVFAGAIGWLSSSLSRERLRWVAFAGLVALLAAGSTLLTSTVARFWIHAARRQDALIAGLRQQLPSLPAGSTLLLDGICPFEGPAPVFVTWWDTRGMLELTYQDWSLRGDVVRPNTEVLPAGIRTVLFDDVINLYPYGDQLIVFHAGTGMVVTLNSLDAARQYFEGISIPGRPTCQPYTDGDGVAIY
ncbi:MAG TPA: hypothetical protein VK939_00165 [Longimicrobiales bacterium]|nr:hypothetical protein [Longimicrobiales bacterium]